MLLQIARDGLHVGGHHVIAGLHGGQLLFGAEEQLGQAFGLLGDALEALELGDQLGEDIPHLAGIGVLDGGQDGVGELGHLLLGVRAVEHHMVGIGHVDGAREALDLPALLLGEGVVQGGGHRGVRLGRLGRFQLGHGLLQGHLGVAVAVQGQNRYFVLTHLSFPPPWKFLPAGRCRSGRPA